MAEDVPARYILVVLGFWGCFLIHAQKVNLSVAIVAMVHEKETFSNVTGECVMKETNQWPDEISLMAVQTPETFDWNHRTQALVLSSYSYGYVLTQIAGGRLAEVVGAKWLYAIGMSGASLLAMLSPIAAMTNPGLFAGLRGVQGLLAGACFPLLHLLLARWIPKVERSFLSTLAYGGLSVGNVGGLLIAGIFCESSTLGGWPSSFYVFGIMGFAWSLAWLYFVYDSPNLHPRISKAELELITSQQNQGTNGGNGIPWRFMLMSPPIWALVAAHVGHTWGSDTLLLELPTYLHEVMGVDIGKNGTSSALPFIMQAICGCLAAFVTDRLLQKGVVQLDFARKACNTIAFFGAALCLFCVVLAGCNKTFAIIVLVMAMGFDGISRAGFFVNHMDLAPEFAGTLMGLTNTIGSIDGFLIPPFVAHLTNGQATLRHWTGVFVVPGVIYITSGALFAVFGSAEHLPWASSPATTKPLIANILAKK